MSRFTSPVKYVATICGATSLMLFPHLFVTAFYLPQNKHTMVWEAEKERQAALADE